MSNKLKKVESISDFLARGGKITVLPPKGRPEKEVAVNSISSGPAIILSLDEADLFYGEPQLTKISKSKKTESSLDINALPASLREKLLHKFQNEVDDEED